MLLDAFKDMDKGMYIQSRTNSGQFNLRGLQSQTKTLRMLICDFFYVDDCALVARILEDVQQITKTFTCAAESFD